MLVHRRVTPSIIGSRYPFIHLGGERHRESKVSCTGICASHKEVKGYSEMGYYSIIKLLMSHFFAVEKKHTVWLFHQGTSFSNLLNILRQTFLKEKNA